MTKIIKTINITTITITIKITSSFEYFTAIFLNSIISGGGGGKEK